ncbi:hypothetical protein FDP41_010439 [Naegleria fowleri]|uniref:Cytochrome P450 n=1 Tax=Naegleria fowleri TaxID=5763 RepID=A0A6A5CA16_NAEFO|nr:uncharacterized protein FDP41_010439 [Naegleria fowleri]KAF0983374.1 hypothetical protein FDP41_010439 [Naegleria fowleri]
MITTFEKNPSHQLRLKDFIAERAQEFQNSDEITTVALSAFLSGAVDITSVMCILFFRIAHEPEYQQKMFEELCQVFGEPTLEEVTSENGLSVSQDQFKKIRLCRNFVDESMRLNHNYTVSARKLSKDVVIGGYQVPKDTTIFILENPELSGRHVPRSTEFIPERFETNFPYAPVNNFCTTPFGLGARKCPGSRIAYSEIVLALVNIVRNFELRHSNLTAFPRMETDRSLFYIDTNKHKLYLKPRKHLELYVHEKVRL